MESEQLKRVESSLEHCDAAEPFVKWAGGKRSLLKYLLPLMPAMSSRARYFEPFLGGGAVFFATSPSKSVLNDLNADLIETYLAVRDEVDSVIRYLSQMTHSKDDFYRIRSSRPKNAAHRAARFIYLNKTCFNGLYRVNQKGEFNVPFGRHGPNLAICNESQLRNASRLLSASTLTSVDFEVAVESAASGDVVYFDPPLHNCSHNEWVSGIQCSDLFLE